MKLILFENIKTHNLLSKTNFDPYDSKFFKRVEICVNGQLNNSQVTIH